MKKLLNNPWVSGILALLAILLVGNSVMNNSSGGISYAYQDTSDEVEDSPSDETIDATPATSKFDLASVQALAEQVSTRNLFERKKDIIATVEAVPEKQAMAEATIKVKGIWIQNNVRYVIIDDQMLQPGQSIEQVRVLRIEDQGVWVTSNQDASSQSAKYIQPGQSWTYQYPKPDDKSQN